MARKEGIDAFGTGMLIFLAVLQAINQVVIKVTNDGFGPVFFAGLRSLGAFFCLLAWMRFRAIPLRLAPGTQWAGVLLGLVFAAEFLFLFLALDLTTVTRTSIIYYSMPVWLTLGAHFLLSGERMTPARAAGLALAFGGVAWAFLDRDTQAGRASLAGDLCALAAALSWAALILCARATSQHRERPEFQILWQLAVSAPILIGLAPLFGPLLRGPEPIHFAGLVYQMIVVASFGFVMWFWLLTIYPASSVASFSFLAPVFSVALGWLLLGEHIGPSVLGALTLVAVGITLINRPARQTTAGDPAIRPSG